MYVSPAERSRAYEALVRKCGDAVLRYIRRRAEPHLADDVFSETMLVTWRRFDDLPEEPIPWLYVTARNCLRNAERSSRRQRRLVDHITSLDPPAESSDPFEEEPQDPYLALALSQLRAPDREILMLWAWEELAMADIATVLGITANAAAIRLHRAKNRLRAVIEKSRQTDSGTAAREEERN